MQHSDPRPTPVDLTTGQVDTYRDEGVVVLRGVFSDWIERLREGAKLNEMEPGPRALLHGADSSSGTFLEDFCNWQRIPAYREFVLHSKLGQLAGGLMQSESVQFFHDHYLHKQGKSSLATPWHQDMPYYCVQGEQTASFWIPLEERPQELSLKSVVASHQWPRLLRPSSWSSKESFYQDNKDFMDVPDIDAGIESGTFTIRSWTMEPGDAVVFDFKTVHGANANRAVQTSRTLSFRLLGDDARYMQRPSRTSPDFPDIGQHTGEKLREDWFPVIWPA